MAFLPFIGLHLVSALLCIGLLLSPGVVAPPSQPVSLSTRDSRELGTESDEGLAVGDVWVSAQSITVFLKAAQQGNQDITGTFQNTNRVNKTQWGHVRASASGPVVTIPLEFSSSQPRRLLLRAVVDLGSVSQNGSSNYSMSRQLALASTSLPEEFKRQFWMNAARRRKSISNTGSLERKLKPATSESRQYHANTNHAVNDSPPSASPGYRQPPSNQAFSSQLEERSSERLLDATSQSGYLETYASAFSAGIDVKRASSLLNTVRQYVDQALVSQHAAQEQQETSLSVHSLSFPLSNQPVATRPLGLQDVQNPPNAATDSGAPSSGSAPFNQSGRSKPGASSVKALSAKDLGSPIDSTGKTLYYNTRVLVGWRCPSVQASEPPEVRRNRKEEQLKGGASGPSSSELFPFYIQPNSTLPVGKVHLERKLREDDDLSDPHDSASRHASGRGTGDVSSASEELSPTERRRRLLQEEISGYVDDSIDSIKPIYVRKGPHSKPARSSATGVQGVLSSRGTKGLCGIDLIKLRPPPSSSSLNGPDSLEYYRNDTSVLDTFIARFSQEQHSDDILFLSPDAPIHIEDRSASYAGRYPEPPPSQTAPNSTLGDAVDTNTLEQKSHFQEPSRFLAFRSPYYSPILPRRRNLAPIAGGEAVPNDPLFELQWALHGQGETNSSGQPSLPPGRPPVEPFRPGAMQRPYPSHLSSTSATNASSASRPTPSSVSPVLDIDVLAAWDLLSPTSPLSQYIRAQSPVEAPQAGQTVPVAIIDTGVNYLHPDLKNSMWINTVELNGIPGVDDDDNGFIDDVYGWNFYHDTNNPMDDNGHGSHVSGIVAATSNNEVGVSGIAPQARLMALKILNEKGEGDVSQAIPAINYAISNNAKVITNSWGGIPSAGGARILEMLLREVVEHSADSVFVIAAGNDGIDISDSPYYPASFLADNTITVGAYDSEGSVPSWANYGKENIHLTAPGQNITSTWKGAGYRMSSGTSMAAPMVSGVAALLLSVNPWLMPQQAVDIIVQTVSVDSGLQPYSITGGRLNAWRSVMMAPAYFLTLDQSIIDFEEAFEGAERLHGGAASRTVEARFSASALSEGRYKGRIETLWLDGGSLRKLVVPVVMVVER